MGAVGQVIGNESDGNVKCDLGGGDNATVDHFADPGEDCPPLPGDAVAVGDGPGTGGVIATGYHSAAHAGQAAAGEKRTFARTAGDVLAAEIWLRGDGSVLIRSVLATAGGRIEIGADGSVTINGVTIDPEGNIATAGTVAAADATVETVPGVPLSLAQHVHTSAAPGSPTTGPIAPPVPP